MSQPRATKAVALGLCLSLLIASASAQTDLLRSRAASDPQGLDAIVRIVTREPVAISVRDSAGSRVPLVTRGTSTGFMVSRCLAVTSYHGVFGETVTRDFAAFPVDVHTQRDRQPIRAIAVDAGRYLPNGNPREDWSLLLLDDCVGSRTGWVEFEPLASDETGNDYLTAGYPAGRPFDQLWIVENCGFTGRDRVTFAYRHDCLTMPGQSGAPIGRFDADGALLVAAMVKSVDPTGTLPGLAIGIEEILPLIGDRIAADRQ